MLRIFAFAICTLIPVISFAIDNAYFQSPTEPQINGQCARLKKSGSNYLWHCVYRENSTKTSPGKKNVQDMTPAEKTAAGYRGDTEASVSAAYKTAGSVGHGFFGIPVFATSADKATGKPKK